MVTQLKLNRMFQKGDRKGEIVKREKPIDAFPKQPYMLDCGIQKIEIMVSPGQRINPRRMCKKLFKLN